MTTVERGTARAAWWFLAPALAVIGVFFFLPVVASLALSFTDFDIYAIADSHNARFVGLANYGQLAATPLFWTALKNTLYFAFVGAPLSVLVALGAALLVNAKLVRFKGFFRTAYFAPPTSHRSSRRSSRSRSCGATCTIRATACSTRPLALSGSGRSTGSATRDGRCRPSSCSPCGATSATTC